MSIVSQQFRRGLAPTLRLVALIATLMGLTALPAASQQRDVAMKRDRMPIETEQPVIWAASTPPSAANIAAILMAADESAVKDAKLAESKSSNPQVLTYARTVSDEHTALEDKVASWAKAKKLEPVQSSTSQQFVSAGDKSRKKLEAAEASRFDGEFAVQQVKFDKTLLAALNDIMIPNAKDPELATLVKSAKPQVEAHLKQAEQLHSSIKA